MQITSNVATGKVGGYLWKSMSDSGESTFHEVG